MGFAASMTYGTYRLQHACELSAFPGVGGGCVFATTIMKLSPPPWHPKAYSQTIVECRKRILHESVIGVLSHHNVSHPLGVKWLADKFPSNANPSHRMSSSAIAGIALGSLVGTALVGGCIFAWCLRWKKKRNRRWNTDSEPNIRQQVVVIGKNGKTTEGDAESQDENPRTQDERRFK